MHTETPTHDPTPVAATELLRARPRWARVIHNLGSDLNWAISGWCNFPRPVRRATAAAVTTAAAILFDADDVVRTAVDVLAD